MLYYDQIMLQDIVVEITGDPDYVNDICPLSMSDDAIIDLCTDIYEGAIDEVLDEIYQ